MRKTRNLFVLISTDPKLIPEVLMHLRFKGTITTEEPQTQESILATFSHNKSIICNNIKPCLAQSFDAIYVNVIFGSFLSDSASTTQNARSPNANSGIPHVRYETLNAALGPQSIIEQFEEIASKHKMDLGDHVSNSSGIHGAPTKKDCAYCKFLQNPIKHKQDVIIYQSEHFFAFTTLGQFTPAYLLLIPFEHMVSLAVMPTEWKNELHEAIEDLRQILYLSFGVKETIVFENGTGDNGNGKALDSVVHLHVHVVGSHLTADDVEKHLGAPLEPIEYDELSKKYGKHSYLLILERGENWRINGNPETYIPRQYIRQLIALELNLPEEEYNWRTNPCQKERLEATEMMQRALRKHKAELPERLRKRTEHFLSLDLNK